MATTRKFSKPCIYQLKITIKHIRPPVWRRVRVPSNINLLQLHSVIQDVFGWTDSHLHEFEIDKSRYGRPEGYEDFGPEMRCLDESLATLEHVVRKAKKRFSYNYDFGDDWLHDILVEKIEAAGPGETKPVCVGGRRRCPPDDCGGPWGYANLLETIQDPEHEDHEEMLEWIGGEFDPEEFDVEDANQSLATVRPWRDRGANWIQ